MHGARYSTLLSSMVLPCSVVELGESSVALVRGVWVCWGVDCGWRGLGVGPPFSKFTVARGRVSYVTSRTATNARLTP